MSIAYWCVLAAAMLPYLTVGIAKALSPYDNADPRRGDLYSGIAGRAHGAHANGFEAFPLFAVAVLVASGASVHGASRLLDALCVLWVVSRCLYVGAYLGNWPTTRSLVWAVGLVISVMIFTMPAWHA